MMSFEEHHQQEHQEFNNKEEKLAAARQKLKQFKQQQTKQQHQQHGSDSHQNGFDQIEPLNNQSGRSTPGSQHSSSSNHHNHQKQSFPLGLSLINESNLNQAQFKEQLQLHVQTIGILVAEKAELQSKLQQQIKKADKKQDECDELMGRLKASRQKINDLERVIQQVNQLQEQKLDNINQYQNLINELNSKDLLIDEFRIKLNEMNEKLSLKQQETHKFAQLSLDLKSQLEIMTLKMSQFENQADTTEKTNNNNNNSLLQEEINRLNEKNSNLEKKLEESSQFIDQQKIDLKQEYQNYVDKLQHQIENLVDQINRMTDERELSFSKIDNLQSSLKQSEAKNADLSSTIVSLESKLTEASSNQKKPLESSEFSNKINLLENEIKYFKQQIEILLHEQNSFKSIIDDKDQSISNLNKLLENYEADREKFNSLLEQSHNDKQTISRILKQNNDLKDQLAELQDAYVKVTQTNLDLTTQLQSEQFKLKNLESSHLKTSSNEDSVSPDWGDNENENSSEDSQLSEASEPKQNLILDTIKKRIDDLEKENKDLNDYITLMNNKQETNNLDENYLNNMKLLEEKFNKVMQENADLREKNQELEHVIQQLQFETETIIDYITMYQMERGKLNEKYKLKDEAIKSLSTQLQVNKLALLEINNYLNAFIKLYQMEKKEETDSSPAQAAPNEDQQNNKKEYILIQIQNLLFNLTQTSSRALSNITNSDISKNSLPAFNSTKASTNTSSIIDEKSIAKFKAETVLCSSCYGDLFII